MRSKIDKMNSSSKVKLYKSGKIWLATLLLGLGTGMMMTNTVKADVSNSPVVATQAVSQSNVENTPQRTSSISQDENTDTSVVSTADDTNNSKNNAAQSLQASTSVTAKNE